MRNGVYITMFEGDGPYEKFIRLGTCATQGVPCFVVSNRPDSEGTSVVRIPLAELVGVQGGAGNPTFRNHFAQEGFVKGVSVASRRTLHPTRLCFTLWFKYINGCRGINCAAVNNTFYDTVVSAMHALRCINTENNHIVGQDNATGAQNAQTHMTKKKKGDCVIL